MMKKLLIVYVVVTIASAWVVLSIITFEKLKSVTN